MGIPPYKTKYEIVADERKHTVTKRRTAAPSDVEGILEVGGPDKLLHVLQPAVLQRFQQAAVGGNQLLAAPGVEHSGYRFIAHGMGQGADDAADLVGQGVLPHL